MNPERDSSILVYKAQDIQSINKIKQEKKKKTCLVCIGWNNEATVVGIMMVSGLPYMCLPVRSGHRLVVFFFFKQDMTKCYFKPEKLI